MSDLLLTQTITCPHCGESIEVVIDLSAGEQSYIEDCSVCCRPMTLKIGVADDELVELTVEAAE